MKKLKIRLIVIRNLLFLLMGILFFQSAGYTQVNPRYKIRFTYSGTLSSPCEDGNFNTYYSVDTSIYNCTLKINDKSYPLDSIYSADEDFEIEVGGAITVNWEKWTYNEEREIITYEEEGYTFEDTVLTITMNQLDGVGACGRKVIELREKVTTPCLRTHSFYFSLYVMPYEDIALEAGSKVCTSEEIELNSWDGDGEIKYFHDWYARINSGNWFSLDINEPDPYVKPDYVYEKSPSVDFSPGDRIQFLVDHGCPTFLFEENPVSNGKLVYSSPDATGSITTISPSCVGGIDGKITVGLVDGLSPTYFRYGLHHYTKSETDNCSDSQASTDRDSIVIRDTTYCPDGISDIITFDLDPDVVEIIIDTSVSNLDTINSGIWQFQIEYAGIVPPDTFLNPCACEDTIIMVDPLPFKLDEIIIPVYKYAGGDSIYNLRYNDDVQNIKFEVSNGNPTYFYKIGDFSGSSTETSFTRSLGGGKYLFSLKDSKGCEAYITDRGGLKGDTLILKEPAVFRIDSINIDSVDCNHLNAGTHNNGAVQFYVSGGIGPYSFIFNNEAAVKTVNTTDFDDAYSKIIPGLTYGEYSYYVKSLYDVDSIPGKALIGEPDRLQIFEASRLLPVCQEYNDGEISLYGEGGTGKYELFKDGTPTFTDIPSGQLSTFNELYEGIEYLIKVQDSLFCSATDTFILEGYLNPLQIEILDSIPPNCIEGIDGKLVLRGSGGHDVDYFPSNYLIDGSFPTDTFENDTSEWILGLDGDETYTLRFNDSKGCYTTKSVYLSDPLTPVQALIIDSAEIQCKDYNNGWVEVTGLQGDKGTEGYHYFITDGSGFNPMVYNDISIKQIGDTVIYNNLNPGLHSIYIADTNDCLNPDITANKEFYRTDLYVYEPPIIEVSYDNTGVSQKGEADAKFWFTATGGNNSYLFELICADTLVASGVTNDSILIDNLAEAEYELKLKDTCNCTEGLNIDWLVYSGIRIESPNEYLKLITGPVSAASCFGGNDGSVTVYGQGGWESSPYMYGIDSIDTNDTGIFENLTSGWYLFHVKDSANVIVYDSVFVPQPDLLTASVKNITDVQCHHGSDGQIALSVTGGVKPYEFSLDGSSWQADSVFTGFEKGNYNIFFRDLNACETSVSADVNQPEPYSVSYTVSETVCGESNGAIECHINGGTKPYFFQWLNNQNVIIGDSVLNNLYSGEYAVTITDSHLCDTSFVIAVSNTDGPQLEIETIDSVSCQGKTDGQIHYRVFEGIAPYHIKLYTGSELIEETQVSIAGSYSFENLPVANYKIIVNDDNDCVRSIDNILLKEPESLILILDSIKHPVCYAYANGQISIHAQGGNGSYDYVWDNGETNKDIKNLASGSYTITATDSKGCYNVADYELIDPERLTVDIGDESTVCEGQTHPLSAEGFTTYNWTYRGEYISSAEEIEVWSEGIYTLEVTDQNGCFASDTFELFVSNDLLVAEFIMPSEANENDTVIAIDISWPEPEHVIWSFSEGIINVSSETYLEEFTFENPGTYTVNLISQKAMCIDSISKQIVVMADTSSMEKSILGANTLIKNFKVFPNPNNGKFSVDVELAYSTAITIDLYNLQQNKLVFRQKGNNQSNYHMEYRFSNLQPGVYLVILYVENEKRNERIVIF